MTPEKRAVIQSALKLQGDLKIKFMELRVGSEIADRMASYVMHEVLTSDVVKPEIRAIYQELDDENQQ